MGKTRDTLQLLFFLLTFLSPSGCISCPHCYFGNYDFHWHYFPYVIAVDLGQLHADGEDLED